MHLQRRDLWLGLLPALAQHLFWFHPLAHLAAREYGLAREGACDAAVLAGHGHGAREYAQLLLRLGIAPRPDAGLASASPDYTFLKRRLTMLKTTRSASSAVALSTTLLVAAVGVLPYRITNAATPPAPPAAATPPAPPTPDAALRPAVPALPGAPPAPTPPLTPPAPGSSDTRGHIPMISARAITRGPALEDESYVLLDDEHTIARGSNGEFAEAAIQGGNGPVLWLRQGNARYVVRDTDLITRFRDAFDDVVQLGEQQATLGARQGSVGAEQGGLGARQGEIGARIAELAMQSVRGGDDATRSTALSALQAESRKLGTQMGTLATQQAALAEQQGTLARKQTDAQARADRQARALVDEAISGGHARRL